MHHVLLSGLFLVTNAITDCKQQYYFTKTISFKHLSWSASSTFFCDFQPLIACKRIHTDVAKVINNSHAIFHLFHGSDSEETGFSIATSAFQKMIAESFASFNSNLSFTSWCQQLIIWYHSCQKPKEYIRFMSSPSKGDVLIARTYTLALKTSTQLQFPGV